MNKPPVLSLIICSCNDGYMGNSLWRLSTSINYVSQKIFELGREDEAEIIVSDWGSEVPLSKVTKLSKEAIALTSFIYIPPELASELQKDSPFAEVYALNVAARRSQGDYVGRIDQDTLVTYDFLKCFFDAVEGNSNPGFDIKRSYMFAARKQLPHGFVKREPDLNELDECIKRFRLWIFSEELKFCHWASPVGILMMHRDMWDDVGGYDERLIYYWFMDVDLGTRLIKKYPIVNIGKKFGYDFFHLEHIRKGFRFRHSHRKLNPDWSKSFDKPVLNPNGADWGLGQHNLKSEKSAIGQAELNPHIEGIRVNQLTIFSAILGGSLRRWAWYQIKYLWYFTKKVRKKPHL